MPQWSHRGKQPPSFLKEIKNPIIAHILSNGSFISQVLSYPWRALKGPHATPKHTQSDRKRAKGKTCSDAWFYGPSLNVCLRFCKKKKKKKASHSVYWPGPFCLGCNDHQSSHPLLHSLWTSKPRGPEVNRWWTAGTLKKRDSERAEALLLAV